jgi:hypothetical protein
MGVGYSKRRFLDLVVDGVSFYDEIAKRGLDYISFLGWSGMADFERKAIARLLGDAEPDAAEGQCTVYVCPECADIGCGAITVKVERNGDRVSWTNVSYEYTDHKIRPDENVADCYQVLSQIDALGPCSFGYSELRSVFSSMVQGSDGVERW